MRYDADHKARTRERVLTVAKQAIRRDGVAGLGVAAVMKDAGLTHGGFYAHFPSRDALIDAAVEDMLRGAPARFLRVTEGLAPAEALAVYIDRYLSTAHRDSATWSCPLPTLSTDVGRLEPSMRDAFARTADRLASLLTPLLATLGPADDLLAKSVVAELVGALALARAIGPTDQSDAILEASRLSIRRRIGLPGDFLPAASGTLQ